MTAQPSVRTLAEVLDELRELIFKNSRSNARLLAFYVFAWACGVCSAAGITFDELERFLRKRKGSTPSFVDGKSGGTFILQEGAELRYKIEYRRPGEEWKLSPLGGDGWPLGIAEESATVFRQDGFEARVVVAP